jgi:hypothetical protein
MLERFGILHGALPANRQHSQIVAVIKDPHHVRSHSGKSAADGSSDYGDRTGVQFVTVWQITIDALFLYIFCSAELIGFYALSDRRKRDQNTSATSFACAEVPGRCILSSRVTLW